MATPTPTRWSGYNGLCADKQDNAAGTLFAATLMLNLLLSVLTLIISSVSVYRMIKFAHKINMDSPFAKSMYIAQLIFYANCVLHCINKIPDIVSSCFSPDSVSEDIFFALAQWSYAYHWISFLFILFLRLKIVFQNSSLAVNCMFSVLSRSILITASVLFPVIYVFIFNDSIPYQFAAFMMGLILFTLMIFSQMLNFEFLRKLYLEHKGDSKADTIELVTKYTVLGLISSIGTFIFVMVMAIMTFKGESGVTYFIVVTGQMLDIFIDTICISLSFKFYDKYYRKWCKPCDVNCNDLCLTLTMEDESFVTDDQLPHDLQAAMGHVVKGQSSGPSGSGDDGAASPDTDTITQITKAQERDDKSINEKLTAFEDETIVASAQSEMVDEYDLNISHTVD